MGGLKDLKQEIKKAVILNREWYSLKSILGNSWAIFFFLLGGREVGKSYAVTDFYVRQWRKYGRPFYWLRLTDASQRKLLMNNAEKLIDPDLRRKYKLDLSTNGDSVYEVTKRSAPDKNGKTRIIEKKLMARVMALSTFYNDKGSGLFDKDFLEDKDMFYNICLDEMNRESNEKNSFDIVYAFTNQLENLVRSTKQKLRVICIGNTLQEASDILCAFNFIPQEFGRFKLKKKRAIIEYIEPTEKYLERRKGTVADILMPTASTFTNKVETDDSLITNRRLQRPTAVVKFRKDVSAWFTIWDDAVISQYNGEKVQTLAMRPYIDDLFTTQVRDQMILMFDSRSFQFKNMITFKTFQKYLIELKPRK